MSYIIKDHISFYFIKFAIIMTTKLFIMKKNRIKYLNLLSLSLFFLFFSSCERIKETKLTKFRMKKLNTSEKRIFISYLKKIGYQFKKYS